MSDVERKSDPRIRLHIQNDSGSYHVHQQSAPETLDVDLVVVASGYKRDTHEELLQSLNHLKSNGGTAWKVNRDYSIEFKEKSIADDVGIWLQGCNESTHGVSDTLLSILAVRGGNIVNSIFGEESRLQHSRANGAANGH